MKNRPSQTLPNLIVSAVTKASILAVLAGLLLFFYSLVQYYQQQHRHIEQLASLLTLTASTPDGADLIAEQVSFLLESEPSIQSIVFYPTTNPLINNDESNKGNKITHWQNALFADTVSFNHAVTSNYIEDTTFSTDITQQATTDTTVSTESSYSQIESENAMNNQLANNSLLGYMNITLDVEKLRRNWFRSNLLFGIITILLAMIWILFILRKLNWYMRDIIALAEVCDTASSKPELEEVSITRPNYEFQELKQIKYAFINLFDRLQKSKQDYDAVIALKQNLYNKELSLNVQRYNFQSMITHELTTSLNAIVGGLQLLENNELSTEQQDTIAIIDKGAQQLMMALEQIIQLNQMEKGQVSVSLNEFNPLQLIADLIAEFEPIAKSNGLDLISNVHHIDYQLIGDADKIKQMLSVLIGNAIKFTPSGHVIIESQLTHFAQSNRWQVSVRDVGIGIGEHDMDDIFNPFFQVDSSKTRRYEGTGLGLPIVKQLAHLVGAQIEVESELGIGTQFTVIMQMTNKKESKNQAVHKNLTAIYYYRHEKGPLLNKLRQLGIKVSIQQYEKSVIEQMSAEQVDILMFAEDIYPDTAESLAKAIRDYETTHRALLIYWYPKHQAQDLDNFEHGLKAAGIDFCHSAVEDSKALGKLLNDWLV